MRIKKKQLFIQKDKDIKKKKGNRLMKLRDLIADTKKLPVSDNMLKMNLKEIHQVD